MAFTDEPAMLVQPPLSGYSQETSHIFTSVFRNLFMQDEINEETVRNLAASKTGDHGYHDRYVEKLQNIQVQWEKKLKKTEEIIEHLKQASEKARAVEQAELKDETEKFDGYEKLGLPPVPSKLHLFLDRELLQSNNLIVPNSFKSVPVASPTSAKTENASTPQFMSSTFSSRLHFDKSIVEDNYLPEPEPRLPTNSTFSQKKTKSRSSTRSLKTSLQSDDKNIWRQCINPQQREAEKKGVAKLQKRADFLKNPRFSDNPRSFLVQSAKTSDSLTNVNYFQPSPSPVLFNNYEANCVYEIKLSLRNVTSSCRQVRVVQPRSPYFSVSHGEFPTDSGLVAPGMCCYYTVQFTPVSLADYDDMLEVKTQSDGSIFVPLRAHRDAPVLTLPDILDCGYSLVGDTKTLKYAVTNNGGPGRFCFALTDENNVAINWNDVSFDDSTSIECDPFILSPSSFALDSKQHMMIQVTFQPNAIKAFSRKLILFCDNFVKKEYIIEGTGEVACLEMQFVEGGICQPKFSETTDHSAEDIIRFDDQTPGVPSYKEVHIKNTVSVPLKYTWVICSPSISSYENKQCHRECSVFSVEPNSGYLTENTITKFMFCFQASDVGAFYDVASLILDNIPTQSENQEYRNCEQTALKVSLKALSVPLQVSLKPPVLIFCGDIYVGLCYCKSVKLSNDSHSPTMYHWQTIDDETCFIDISPSTGEIDAQSEKEFVITIRGRKPGKIHQNVICEVPYSQQHQRLYIEATFMGPNIHFLETTLDFGLVRYGKSQDRDITLYNDSPTDASWSIKEFHNIENLADFIFIPSEGSLPAFHKQSISVYFKPHCCLTLNSFLENTILNGNTSYLPIHAEVQRPQIVLEASRLTITEAFLHIPTTHKVVLVNTTLLESKFNWNEVSDKDGRFSISFKPKQGILLAREQQEIDVTLTCHQLGNIEFLATCHVEDALQPLVLSVNADVSGLSVDFYIPNMKDLENEAETIRNSDIIDFGNNVILGEPTCCLLMIENQSGISTAFSVNALNFPPARLPTPPVERNQIRVKRPLLSKTVNIADYDSKTEDQAKREYKKNVLRDGRGVAFVCSPSSGDLKAFEKKIITVTAYSDMWGEYYDTLALKLDNLHEKRIPVHIDVIGSPLNFQMAKTQPALIRFGAHLCGGNDVHRSMKINNTSHVDIRLDWKTFVIDPNDEQLLDFDVYIGNPFPAYDEQGDEIADDDEEYGNDKLIQVRLTEHYGRHSSIPFDIKKSQVLIPALDSSNVDVTFHPMSDAVQKDTNYLGYGLAYMSLHKQDKASEGAFRRSDGLNMLPFALNMNGAVQAAKILMEACDDEGFTFQVCATDLMSKEADVISCRRRFVLVNVSGASVSFRCRVDSPFKMINIDNGKTLLASSKKMISLKPQKNVEIVIEFQLNRSLLSGIDSYETSSFLSIQFNNDTEQRYNLIGQVVFPKILLSHDVLDFNTCFVGETKEMSVTIANDSVAALFWQVEKDPKCPQTSQSVFELSSSKGQLRGRKANEPNHSVDVTISFAPKHNVTYGCVLYLHSTLHSGIGSPLIITLNGKGTYDEAYKEKI